jgi:hypothetical protein
MSNLLEALAAVPDPRASSGRRHALGFVLVLVMMAMMSGYHGYRAVGDFILRHARALRQHFRPPHNRLPSYSPVRRMIMGLDFEALVAAFRAWATAYVPRDDQEWLSLDGKSLKGTVSNAQNSQHAFRALVSVFAHHRGMVVATQRVEHAKESELGVVQPLIEALDLPGGVYTLDALHCKKKRPR